MTLAGADLARVAAQFGADSGQVRRDHLISHVLGALAAEIRRCSTPAVRRPAC